MNPSKKLFIRTFIILYALSYFLQNIFFVDRKKVYAAENPSTTNIVAVFVDKNIYAAIKANLVWYTTQYIQQKIANSKAVVLPIDTSTLKAHEISQMLENMYFEGLQDESSKLVGTILIGDVPLPVVENNGFIYPSIFPYVDFEHQQFIYDANKKFFVYNDNPNGQAELRHGIIKFDAVSEYNNFFNKVKSYNGNPTAFIDKAIWYDDFIGTKKYFIPENTKYYINNLVFAEDIGYHRFNSLLVNVLKNEHNESTLAVGNDLQTDLQNVEDPELQAYAADMKARNDTATSLTQAMDSSMPTLTLKKATEEMVKGYDGLISSQFLSKIKDNIAGLARWYKTTDGETFTEYSSVVDKVAQKDNRLLGNIDNDVQPLLIQMNDFFENKLNTKIQDEKYYMTIPIPVSQLNFEGALKLSVVPKCIWKTYNYYENYFFGANANQVTSAGNTSIFRGTYQNLNSISGQNITATGQSIGGSYKLFSLQTEANRGYNIDSTQEELARYDILKTNRQDLRNKECNLHLFGYCIRRKKTRKPQDSDDENKCYIGDEEQQGGCETLTGFSARYRGGASPMNIIPETQKLANYNYKDAKFPIYDIAGSKKIDAPQADANSYAGVMTYTNMIQKRFAVKEKQEEKYRNINSFINNPEANGIDIKFTNQIVSNSDLEHPQREYNSPKTYTDTNFFTQFGTTSDRRIAGGKAILYNRQNGSGPGRCTVQGDVYTYKTIDSRVQNISPTRNQINGTDFYKFKEGSELYVFYTNVMTELAKTKAAIVEKNLEFSGENSTDIEGTISSLTQLKQLVASGNNGIQTITSFNVNTLASMDSTGLALLVNERSGKNLNPAKISEISGRVESINNGLDGLLNYINNLNISNVGLLFSNIIQTEAFKGQEVEIINTWKNDITQNLDYITSNTNVLKATFATGQGIYNTIGQVTSATSALSTKRNSIEALQFGNGCTINYYKPVCDILDTIIATLSVDTITDINDKITKIHLYDEEGITVQPFVEIDQAFTPPAISSEITQVKTTLGTFVLSTDLEKKETTKGMNLTTSDRPIDNIRNITFQGVGGSSVRLNYPNLYEVKVYEQSGDKLILKTPTEIREAIKTYLRAKAEEYNALLNAQAQNKSSYYNSLSAQFTMLGQLDPLANPNTHSYNEDPIPTNYFIDQLITFLNTLEDAPEYGKTAIYGKSKSISNDDKLDMVAKLLYYQNISWPERLQQTSVADDIAEIKDSFDINQKTRYIVDTYLTEGNDQGKFITPVYNATGYEIGYINSDGEDYVSAKPTPTFIQQIQTAQEKTPAPKNTFVESQSSSDDLQAEVDSCEGVDVNGSAALFDFKTFSSPWGKAMVCRGKSIIKQPLERVKISFKNSLGPVFLPGSAGDGVNNVIDTAGEQRTEYGSQRSAPNNDEIISNAPEGIKSTLQGYNNYGIINTDKTIIGVDYSGNIHINLGMTQDVGNINVKISGTGDNCFGISHKGTSLSNNICTKKAQALYNPNTDEYIFDGILQQKTAGITTLKIELCPGTSNTCIIKQQVLNILPGPIATINIDTVKITTPIIVMEGGELPLVVSAVDSYGNKIGQNIQPYIISVNSGDGLLSDGINNSNSIKFDNFGQAGFIYTAPTGIKDNTGVTITVTQDISTQKLLINQPAIVPKSVQKNIIVAKGIITIAQNNIVLYQTNSKQQIQSKINFTLPKDESSIQYIEEDGTKQIHPENVPSISLTIKDKNGNKLDTVANITSNKGFLVPGTMKEKSIIKNNITKTQTLFSPNNNFIITNGKLDITLYPNFKAGKDTITINIPGIDPIIIPVIVNPGDAKTVLLKLEKSRLDFTSTPISKGTIDVVDTRNNKVTKPTAIKLGVIGAATSNVNEFNYTGKSYTYTLTAKTPGGESYVFAYIKDRTLSDQMPGYERFIVQESVLPKEKLNVMYLNLFGTDRGNQRGYFSENNKAINTIMSGSNKLLASTTQLVDPSKIKQIAYILSPNGQIQSISNKEYTLSIENKEFVALLSETANIHLGATDTFKIQTVIDSGAIDEFTKDANTIVYIPEPTDSIISGNEATDSTILINGTGVLDLVQGTIDPNISITTDNETLGDMSTYTMTFNGTTIGKLMLWNNTNIATTTNIDLVDPITYATTPIFSEGSTNTQGIGIFISSSAFTKQGYQSIEDSSDGMLGIGFTNNFKNVANFANGKSVGEATLPYGSHFLINFGDPLLERRENNPNIPDTDFDASIGQTIYADPEKTIFKTLPIDFNKDGIKDLIVVYTDGVVKLVKNYGGTEAYKNLQELMIIAEPIKDIKIGDADGNGYEDIFIITSNGKGIVYANNKGIFPVDGKNICLNVSTEPGSKNSSPDDFSSIQQLFVEDMDHDGKLDIVTNDSLDDIKVFYGGSTKNGANYISSVTGACDSNRYSRQQNNFKTIKRFGTKINSSRYIQDASLIHRNGIVTPTEGTTEEVDEEGLDGTEPLNKDQMLVVKDQSIDKIKTMITNNDEYVAAGVTQLAYVTNPLPTIPVYESGPSQDISYLPINETNDAVSVYKEYADINGGVLRQDDEIVIKTTILSKKNNNKLTYIDQLQGPRSISKNTNNVITSLVFLTNNTGGLLIDREGPEGYQFVMDNIQLNSGEKLSFSYKVKYQKDTPTMSIDVKDQDLLKEDKAKDTYADIIINSSDACLKNRWIFFNTVIGNKRAYEQIYDDLQEELNNYNALAKQVQEDTINNIVDDIAEVTSLDSLSELPGLNNLEQRSPKNLINSLTSQGGLSLNVAGNFIDNATKKVSKKLDALLQGLCQGFKLGKGGCQGIPVPFNQAFLAPGDYHIFGCVPKAPNPLFPVFKTLNNTLGKGMPVLTIPGNRPAPPPAPPYIPAPGFFGFPFKGTTDGFFLGTPGGAYPSQFRLYLAPTLTLGMGIAMCFGPYTVGKAIPKPFKDLGGNCIVFAIPPLTVCGKNNPPGVDNQPVPEILDTYLVDMAAKGVCATPPKIGNTLVFAEDPQNENNNNNNNGGMMVSTANSPLQIVAAGSSENNPPYSAAIPQGNFGGLVSMDQDPIRVSANEDYGNFEEQQQGSDYEGYQLEKGPKVTLKIVGAKAKGLVKCVIQDRTTRQIQYIQNNLTKMTIQLDLPDMTSVFQGFDKIGNLSETYKAINAQDKSAGYVQGKLEDGLTKQQINNLSQQAGQNPFEAIQQIFKEVPLVNIDTQTVNIKIPTLTTDDIKKYQSYLTLRIEKNAKIIEDRTEVLNQVLAMCGTTSKADAQAMKTKLATEKIAVNAIIVDTTTFTESDRTNLLTRIDAEIADMDRIIALPQDTTRKDMSSDIKNIGINIENTAKKIGKLPQWRLIQTKLVVQKIKEKENFSTENQARLDTMNAIVNDLQKCSGIAGNIGKFITFKENSAGLIRSIKQNINVLEKYKQFPTQLYQWTHLTDRYLTEISSLISDFVGGLTRWLNTNATRFSQYVDAITLIVGAIKTRQAIIDFSINRSEKCSKCSNDNYGSFSCSLSFLCPKLPIFPIPAFKIPNIYMDMSHIDLGMNIILPKMNFVPLNIPLPQLPNLPEPPSVEIDRDILMGLDIDFFKNLSLPTIPVMPEPPVLPEPPSFIPSIKIDLPVLPPAPKIPKILPEIKAILKVATFIGKIFCIVKGGIGLVGEKGVKGKIEQITQRTWNVPFFDFFNLTTKFKDPPLQGFDYKIDAYATLKFNFDGVYDVFNNIAQTTNNLVTKAIEAPIQKAVERVTDNANNNSFVTGILTPIEDFDQNINFNGYNSVEEETDMMDYTVAYNELRQGLISFKNDAITDKTMSDRVQVILATVENKSTILPATKQIEEVERAAKEIINDKIKENQDIQKEIQEYDTFIKNLKENEIVLVADTTTVASLKTPILTIDSPTKHILQSQEDPTKTYLTLNQKMVQGYLDAVNNDGPEKLNMTTSVYTQSKKYLETTKEKIDTALIAYNDKPLLAQAPPCINCENPAETNNYSADISAYVNGVFIESYSGTEKSMVNTVSSVEQSQNVQRTYTTTTDLNNDNKADILMHDANSIYIKYADQEAEHFSQGGNKTTTHYGKFYSYASEHPGNIFNSSARYIAFPDQLRDNSDAYGYMTINDITIKVIDKNKEVKNFRTDGQSFDNLQMAWKNSSATGEPVDGYIIRLSNKVDDKDTPNSFRDFLGIQNKFKYILVLPKDTDYKKGLLTIDNTMIKKPINLELGESILAVEYYEPTQEKISMTFKDLPRKWLYTSISALTISQDELSTSQQKSLTLYKKTSPRSNQTVAGLQNLGDLTAPVGQISLYRNVTDETISEGLVHEGYINTTYTLKSIRTDNVIVAKMEIRKDGKLLTGTNNQSQTGTIDVGGLFFTGATQQSYDFVAIDQNNNVTKETVTLEIKIPDIEVIDVKTSKNGTTAEIIAQISNDLDEGMVIFQRLRNGIRKNIEGSDQSSGGGFELSPKQTIITGGIFTMGNDIGMYDNQGNELATIDPKTGEIKISQGFQDKIKINLSFTTHIPVVELKDINTNLTLFQIILPIDAITNIEMNVGLPDYEQIQLTQGDFGAFTNGYCIKNSNNECILYTNTVGAIYIPGIYASSLLGEYLFDKTLQTTKFIVKDQSNKPITTLTLQIKDTK